MNDILWLMLALFTKHLIVDFPLQVRYQYSNKGTYGHPGGILHAALHGMGTWICLAWYAPEAAIYLSFVDAVIHYHIDWAKMNINKRWNYTIEQPQFWAWLGADQLAHSLTYLGLVWLAV